MEVKKRRKLNWKSKRDRKKRHNTKTVTTLKNVRYTEMLGSYLIITMYDISRYNNK